MLLDDYKNDKSSSRSRNGETTFSVSTHTSLLILFLQYLTYRLLTDVPEPYLLVRDLLIMPSNKGGYRTRCGIGVRYCGSVGVGEIPTSNLIRADVPLDVRIGTIAVSVILP